MKMNNWHSIVFIAYLAYCALFAVLFYCGFAGSGAFRFVIDGLLLLCGVNTICQIVAVAKAKKLATSWLLLGWLLCIVTIGFTIGQGV